MSAAFTHTQLRTLLILNLDKETKESRPYRAYYGTKGDGMCKDLRHAIKLVLHLHPHKRAKHEGFSK